MGSPAQKIYNVLQAVSDLRRTFLNHLLCLLFGVHQQKNTIWCTYMVLRPFSDPSPTFLYRSINFKVVFFFLVHQQIQWFETEPHENAG